MSSSEIKGVCLKNQSDIKVINQDIQNINVDVSNKIDISEKGASDGVCPLNVNTQIDKVYLQQIQGSEVENTPNGNITSVDVQGAIDELDINKIESSLIGSANGVCPLDASSKIDIQYLSGNVLVFKGLWDGSTNTPSLSNGTGANGDVYICQIGGTVDFGAGPITFDAKDWVIYSDNVWNKVDNNDAITSVFGRVGDIVSQASDYNAGQIDYTGVLGSNVQDALNQIDAITEKTANKGVANGYAPLDAGGLVPLANLPAIGGAVDSVFGRTGVVVSQSGDYNAGQVSYAGTVAGADVATAINTLDAEKAPLQDPVFTNSIALGATHTINGADSISFGTFNDIQANNNYCIGNDCRVLEPTSERNFLLGDNLDVQVGSAGGNYLMGLTCRVDGGGGNKIIGQSCVVTPAGGLNTIIGENNTCRQNRNLQFGFGCDCQGLNNVQIGTDCQGLTAPRQGTFMARGNSAWNAVQASTGSRDCTFVYEGGYRLFTSATNGASLPSGTTTWTSISDRNKKKNFKDINKTDVLNKIHNMNCGYYQYKENAVDENGDEIVKGDNVDYHIGCVSQDFYSAFHNMADGSTLHGDDKTINSGNLCGILMCCIQELKTQLDSLKSRVAELEAGSA